MSDINLSPCPFCGKLETVHLETVRSCEECGNFESDACPAYEPFDDQEDRCPYKAVVCIISGGGCGASSGWYPSAEEAARKWNRRV